MLSRRAIVGLPVKDEADRLTACLRALAAQGGPDDLTVVVLINNSSDGSAGIARRIAGQASCHIVVREVIFGASQASAGAARRMVMQMVADLAVRGDVLLTTDADSRVQPGWLRANLSAIGRGADAVAGRAIIDPNDEALIPEALIEADARECRYAALLDEIVAYIDPDAADPWPRHDEHSGASIAVTEEAFRRIGGFPDIPLGEDRALFRNLRCLDARIRHDPDVKVIVSGRTDGRAKGGMADTIRRRMVCPDMFLDDRLEAVHDAVLRAKLRRRARLLWSGRSADLQTIVALAHELDVSLSFLRERLASRTFGAAWDDLETASPALRRRPVPTTSVGHEIAVATAILSEWTHTRNDEDMLDISA
jgi:GT2 family glycosyltransferase